MRITDSRNFTVSERIAAALIEVEPGGMRELHWHPNSDEWQYHLSGRSRMTVFASGGAAQTFDYQAGDVGYIPRAMPHYVENRGTTVSSKGPDAAAEEAEQSAAIEKLEQVYLRGRRIALAVTDRRMRERRRQQHVVALVEPAERAGFEADYALRLRVAYPRRADGSTLFPFRRLFIVADSKFVQILQFPGDRV